MNWVKKHKKLTVFIGIMVVLIIAISASGSGGGDTTKSTSDTSTKTEPEATTAKIGEPARDGKFEFTVKSLECGKPNVGSQYLTKTAQGQYCLLNIGVKNIGDEAQSLYSGNQYLFNDAGQKFSADSTATAYADTTNSVSWFSEINPGNSVEGALVFDVPKDVVITQARLHDSAFSNGVIVNL